jgi:hypothetical protein
MKVREVFRRPKLIVGGRAAERAITRAFKHPEKNSSKLMYTLPEPFRLTVVYYKRQEILHMKIDNFVRTCLVLIVLLLGVIAFKPAVTPRAVVAAVPTEWSCIDMSGNEPQSAIKCSERLKIAQQEGFQFVGADLNLFIMKK